VEQRVATFDEFRLLSSLHIWVTMWEMKNSILQYVNWNLQGPGKSITSKATGQNWEAKRFPIQEKQYMEQSCSKKETGNWNGNHPVMCFEYDTGIAK
jgi:hypothetical protein